MSVQNLRRIARQKHGQALLMARVFRAAKSFGLGAKELERAAAARAVYVNAQRLATL